MNHKVHQVFIDYINWRCRAQGRKLLIRLHDVLAVI